MKIITAYLSRRKIVKSQSNFSPGVPRSNFHLWSAFPTDIFFIFFFVTLSFRPSCWLVCLSFWLAFLYIEWLVVIFPARLFDLVSDFGDMNAYLPMVSNSQSHWNKISFYLKWPVLAEGLCHTACISEGWIQSLEEVREGVSSPFRLPELQFYYLSLYIFWTMTLRINTL